MTLVTVRRISSLGNPRMDLSCCDANSWRRITPAQAACGTSGSERTSLSAIVSNALTWPTGTISPTAWISLSPHFTNSNALRQASRPRGRRLRQIDVQDRHVEGVGGLAVLFILEQ